MNVSRISFYPSAAVLILLLAGFSPTCLYAQGKGTDNEDEALPAVAMHCDPRVEILAHFSESAKPAAPGNAAGAGLRRGSVSGSIRSAHGFRIIIYSGIDRNKATSTKVDFMRRYPGIRVYMSYALPQYRVKVGDFLSRGEASGLYLQLNKQYSPCMIVPDIVEINTFRRNNDPANTSKEP
ncbi:hypothetical protein [Rurimicrobium arvi]